MSAQTVAVLALSLVAGAEMVGLIIVIGFFLRSRRDLERLRRSTVSVARGSPRLSPGRAMRAVVDTAARVRDQGVSGFLASSLEELSRWATEDRAQISRVAAADGTVTIFFSDIEDSTTLNERLGDDRWVRVLEAHGALIRERVARHLGHVVKSQGDGFMIVFGDPVAAARAAREIQQAIERGTRRSLRRHPISIRVGMHVGRVVARDGDYFGRNVALAARVAGHAAGGQILVSDDIHAALDDVGEFDLRPCGEIELKGLSDRHMLWELDWSA